MAAATTLTAAMRGPWTPQPMETARMVGHSLTLVSGSLAAGHRRVYQINIQLRLSMREVHTLMAPLPGCPNERSMVSLLQQASMYCVLVLMRFSLLQLRRSSGWASTPPLARRSGCCRVPMAGIWRCLQPQAKQRKKMGRKQQRKAARARPQTPRGKQRPRRQSRNGYPWASCPLGRSPRSPWRKLWSCCNGPK